MSKTSFKIKNGLFKLVLILLPFTICDAISDFVDATILIFLFSFCCTLDWCYVENNFVDEHFTNHCQQGMNLLVVCLLFLLSYRMKSAKQIKMLLQLPFVSTLSCNQAV